MTEPTVVFYNLRAHPTEYQPALRAAYELGLRVVLVTSSPGSAPTDNLIADVHAMVGSGGPETVAQGADIVSAVGAVGVMTWSDTDVMTVSRVCDRVGLPAPPVNAAMLTRNKWLGRLAVAAASESVIPRFRLVQTPDDMRAAWSDIGSGGVLKPVSGAGSAGVERVHSIEDALAAAERLFRFSAPATHPLFLDGPGQLIYEEFLSGTEHSVEGFVCDGLPRVAAITDKVTDSRSFLEIQHMQPTRLLSAERDEVTALATTVTSALMLDNCSFHLECKVDAGTPKLVEIAARIGGGHITSHLVPLVAGENFYANAVRLATGSVPVPASRPTGRCAGVAKILAPTAGVFTSFADLDGLRQMPGVEAVAIHRQFGDLIAVPPEDYPGALLASVVVSAAGSAELDRSLERVRELLVPIMA